MQKFGNYTILFVDDASNYTIEQKSYIKKKLKGHIVIFNKERKYAIRNAYEILHQYAIKRNSVVVNVDGDDWLFHDQVLNQLQKVYESKNPILTYGNCLYFCPQDSSLHLKRASDIFEFNHRFPERIEKGNSYRRYHFIPLHLRTWRTDSFKKIPISSFYRPDKTWLQFCEDQAIFYPLLEQAKGKYEVINEIQYVYNRSHDFNDSKLNKNLMLVDELLIRKKNR